MNTNLDLCLAIQRAHASLRLKLDDELGIYHGISFSDFVLLDILAQKKMAGLVLLNWCFRSVCRSQLCCAN